MSLPSDLNHETRLLLHLARNWWRLHWRAFVAVQVVLLAVIWLVIHPYDRAWLAAVQKNTFGFSERSTLITAGKISTWGDFPGFNVILAIGLWVAGQCFHRPRWKRLALMTVMAALLAGVTTTVVRIGLGRTRPKASVPDGFYGPHRSTNYQSCPSGHTTTAFAAAVPLLIAAPPLGVPCLFIASSVGWSRMHLGRHYPTDVAMAIWVALWFAVPLGFAARVRRISDEPPTPPRRP